MIAGGNFAVEGDRIDISPELDVGGKKGDWLQSEAGCLSPKVTPLLLLAGPFRTALERLGLVRRGQAPPASLSEPVPSMRKVPDQGEWRLAFAGRGVYFYGWGERAL